MSLDPNVSAEINHALPLRHCGAKSTKGYSLAEDRRLVSHSEEDGRIKRTSWD
jgi:hypothetical protein